MSTVIGFAGSLIFVSSPAFLTVCSGVSFPVFPSFVTVTLPLLSTVIVASAKSGLAAITAALILPCSSVVTSFGLATSTGVGAFTPSLESSCFTVFSGLIVPISLPSLSLIVTVPSSATSIVAPSGRVLLPEPSLFASSTAFLTLSLSSFVKALALSTVIGDFGAFIVVSWPAFGATVTVTFTVSLDPSLYFTTTGILISLPASSSLGVYLTSPFASIVAPVGASSPNLKVVPAGIATDELFLSVKFGPVIVVGLPAWASASV